MPEQNEMQKTYLSLKETRSLRDKVIASGIAAVGIGAVVSCAVEDVQPVFLGLVAGFYAGNAAMGLHDIVKTLSNDLAHQIEDSRAVAQSS